MAAHTDDELHALKESLAARLKSLEDKVKELESEKVFAGPTFHLTPHNVKLGDSDAVPVRVGHHEHGGHEHGGQGEGHAHEGHGEKAGGEHGKHGEHGHHVEAKEGEQGKVDKSTMEFKFQLSMWDAAMLMGTEETGFGADCITVILLCTNVLCQMIFMAILILQFFKSEWNDELVSNMQAWRSSVGHSAAYYDPFDGRSLAERVCALDETLAVGIEKVNTMKELKAYWTPEETTTFFSGPSLALVCVLAWTNTVVGEITKVWTCFILVVVSLPGNKPELPQWPGVTDITGNIYDGYQLSFVSVYRRAWVLLLLVMQLTVAAILLIVGCFFITETASVETLLLHALAMELIFTIDERIFEALAPSGVANVVEYMKPLEAHIWSWRGLDIKSMVLVPGVMGWILLINYIRLQDVLNHVKQVQDALCSGNTNFIYAQDALGLLWVTQTLGQAAVIKSGDWQLASDLMGGGILQTYPFQAGTYQDLSSASAGVTSDVLQVWQNASSKDDVLWCSDIYSKELGSSSTISSAVFAYGPKKPTGEALAKEGFESCEDAKDYCSTSGIIRALCPSTCQCDHPFDGVFNAPIPTVQAKQIAAGIRDGCPATACYLKGSYYQETVTTLPCGSEPVATAAWADWATQLKDLLNPANLPPGKSFPDFDFLSMKCNYIGNWTKYWDTDPDIHPDPCNGIWTDTIFTKPLNPLCPVTCKCRLNPGAVGCPSSCQTR